MRVLERHPFVEEMAARWVALYAQPARPTRHAYRVLNYARALIRTERHNDELALLLPTTTSASGRTGHSTISGPRSSGPRPSPRGSAGNRRRATRVADSRSSSPTTLTGIEPALRDAFRRADLVDVSRGTLRAGLPAAFVREVANRSLPGVPRHPPEDRRPMGAAPPAPSAPDGARPLNTRVPQFPGDQPGLNR
jgi:hypothetical protein